MSKDRPAGMDNLSFARRKPQTDRTKPVRVGKIAGGKIDNNKVEGVKGLKGKTFGTGKGK